MPIFSFDVVSGVRGRRPPNGWRILRLMKGMDRALCGGEGIDGGWGK